MAKSVAWTYGEALFELGMEKGTLLELEKEAVFCRKELQDNPEFRWILSDPAVSKEEKKQFLESCFRNRISEDMTGLFCVAVQKGRGKDLERILEGFLDKAKEYRKVGIAQVVTATELDDAAKKKVEDKLLSTSKYETMEITYRVDESLIAGMIIHMGGKVVDNTVKHRMEELKSRLMKISLEDEKAGENVL